MSADVEPSTLEGDAMTQKPAWRTLYDRMAKEVGPRMTDATGSDVFADAANVAETIATRAASEFQRTSRRFLHAWNLPAGSDVALLRQELGALDREVRALSRQVEALRRDLAAADAAEPSGSRADPAARRRPRAG